MKRHIIQATCLAFIALVPGCDLRVSTTGTVTSAALDSPGYLRASVPAITLSPGDNRPLDGLITTIDGSVFPEKLVWSSSNPGVVSMDAGGTIATARGVGSATLTATLPSTPFQRASITFNVMRDQKVREIVVSPQNITLDLTPDGSRETLTAEVRLADGQINGNVSWTTSDATIASVNPQTGQVQALREGRVTILATYQPDAQFKGLTVVTVVKLRPTPTPAPTPTPQPTPEPTPTPIPTPLPTPTPIPIPSPTSESSPTPTPTATPTATPTPEPSPIKTASPSPAPSTSPTPSPTPQVKPS